MGKTISETYTKYRDGLRHEFSVAYVAADERNFHDFTMAELDIHKTCASIIDDLTAEKQLIQKNTADADRQSKEHDIDAIIAELKAANDCMQDNMGKRSGYTGFKKVRGPEAQKHVQKAVQLLDDFVRHHLNG